MVNMVANMLTTDYFCREGTTLTFIWNCICVHLINISPVFSLVAAIWSSTNPKGNIWLFRCYMLQYIHQLVANSYRCLAQSRRYTVGLSEPFSWKQLPVEW